MKWIECELDLNNVSLNGDDKEYFSSINSHFSKRQERQLTNRQIDCFVYCMNLINDKEYSKAYHELFDFIHDYGRKDGKPLSNNEVKGLKLIVDEMKRGLNPPILHNEYT